MIASPFRLAFAAAFATSLAVAPAAAAPELGAARTNVSQAAAKKIEPRQARSKRPQARDANLRVTANFDAHGCLAGCTTRLTVVGAGFGF